MGEFLERPGDVTHPFQALGARLDGARYVLEHVVEIGGLLGGGGGLGGVGGRPAGAHRLPHRAQRRHGLREVGNRVAQELDAVADELHRRGDFVGDAGGQQADGREAFRVHEAMGRLHALGDVDEDAGVRGRWAGAVADRREVHVEPACLAVLAMERDRAREAAAVGHGVAEVERRLVVAGAETQQTSERPTGRIPGAVAGELAEGRVGPQHPSRRVEHDEGVRQVGGQAVQRALRGRRPAERTRRGRRRGRVV